MTDVVYDSFAGANGTPIDSHVGEVGATWARNPNWGAGTANGTSLLISGNALRPNSYSENPNTGNAERMCYPSGRLPPGTTKFSLEFPIRWTFDSSTFAYVAPFEKADANPGNLQQLFYIGNQGIAYYDGSSHSVAFSPVVNQWYITRLDVDGVALKLYVDNVLMAAWNRTTPPLDAFGLDFFDSQQAGHPQVDSFRVSYTAPTDFWTSFDGTRELTDVALRAAAPELAAAGFAVVGPSSALATQSPQPEIEPRALTSFLLDQFTGTAGPLTSHISDSGAGWIAARGPFATVDASNLRSNSLVLNLFTLPGSGAALSLAVPQSRDQSVGVQMYPSAYPVGEDFYVLLRWDESGASPSGYAIKTRRKDSSTFFDFLIWIQRYRTSGNNLDLLNSGAAGTPLVPAGGNASFTVRLFGAQFSFDSGGTANVLTFTDPDPILQTGRVGVALQQYQTGTFLNVDAIGASADPAAAAPVYFWTAYDKTFETPDIPTMKQEDNAQLALPGVFDNVGGAGALAIAGPASALPATLTDVSVLLDNFTGTGTVISHVSDSGHTWTNDPNGWAQSGSSLPNELTLDGGGFCGVNTGPKYTYVSVASNAAVPANCFVEAKVRINAYTTSGRVVIQARYNPADGSGIVCEIANGYAPDAVMDMYWYIGPSNSGRIENGIGFGSAPADPANYLLRLEFEGPAIRIYVDGVLIWSSTDSTITQAGTVGFTIRGDSYAQAGLSSIRAGPLAGAGPFWTAFDKTQEFLA